MLGCPVLDHSPTATLTSPSTLTTNDDVDIEVSPLRLLRSAAARSRIVEYRALASDRLRNAAGPAPPQPLHSFPTLAAAPQSILHPGPCGLYTQPVDNHNKGG